MDKDATAASWWLGVLLKQNQVTLGEKKGQRVVTPIE